MPDRRVGESGGVNPLKQRRAVGEIRTRDPQLGKLMLYQLSYYRN